MLLIMWVSYLNFFVKYNILEKKKFAGSDTYYLHNFFFFKP